MIARSGEAPPQRPSSTKDETDERSARHAFIGH